MAYKGLAIVSDANMMKGRDKLLGYTILSLKMIHITGEKSGQSFYKRYYIKQEIPEQMQKELLQLGYCVTTLQETVAVCTDLIGKIALVSIEQNEGKAYCLILGYMGSDDPKKYDLENK